MLDAASSSAGVGLFELSAQILRGRRKALIGAISFGLAVGLAILVRPREYTAGASLIPQVSNLSVPGLTGLASQLGISVPSGNESQSPAFYGYLLSSNSVLEPLVMLKLRSAESERTLDSTFIQYSTSKQWSKSKRLITAIEKARKAMTVTVAAKTGVVSLSFRTRDAAWSDHLARGALALVDSFNVRSRRSKATAQRLFVEGRLTRVTEELRSAEDQLKVFVLRNRSDLRSSPDLLLEHERLNRVVSQRNQVYVELLQALEQAKLDEVRDTPSVSVISPVRYPWLPDPRYTVQAVSVAMLFGLIGGVLLELMLGALARRRVQEPEAASTLDVELHSMLSELRELQGRLRRVGTAKG